MAWSGNGRLGAQSLVKKLTFLYQLRDRQIPMLDSRYWRLGVQGAATENRDSGRWNIAQTGTSEAFVASNKSQEGEIGSRRGASWRPKIDVAELSNSARSNGLVRRGKSRYLCGIGSG